MTALTALLGSIVRGLEAIESDVAAVDEVLGDGSVRVELERLAQKVQAARLEAVRFRARGVPATD